MRGELARSNLPGYKLQVPLRFMARCSVRQSQVVLRFGAFGGFTLFDRAEMRERNALTTKARLSDIGDMHREAHLRAAPCCKNCIDSEVLGADIASRFLLETLLSRPKLWERDGTSFLTTHMWRAAIRKYQIAALRILKGAAHSVLVGAVAQAISALIEKSNGGMIYATLIPVPCGHSSIDACLSVSLARALAQRYGVPCDEALSGPHRSGSSHPKQSMNWPRPHLIHEVRGPALVIDDVCTTGRHMSQSLIALRSAGVPASGVAWIAGK